MCINYLHFSLFINKKGKHMHFSCQMFVLEAFFFFPQAKFPDFLTRFSQEENFDRSKTILKKVNQKIKNISNCPS